MLRHVSVGDPIAVMGMASFIRRLAINRSTEVVPLAGDSRSSSLRLSAERDVDACEGVSETERSRLSCGE